MAEEKPGRVKVQAQPLRHRVDENAVVPLCDIHEAKDGTTVLEVEVPGARPETVDVRVEKGVLTIYADGRLAEPDKDGTCTYRGFAGGQYFRAFALSDQLDREKVSCSLNEGVLVVRLPRAAAAQPRKIPIKQG